MLPVHYCKLYGTFGNLSKVSLGGSNRQYIIYKWGRRGGHWFKQLTRIKRHLCKWIMVHSMHTLRCIQTQELIRNCRTVIYIRWIQCKVYLPPERKVHELCYLGLYWWYVDTCISYKSVIILDTYHIKCFFFSPEWIYTWHWLNRMALIQEIGVRSHLCKWNKNRIKWA